jgi:hypothetical protein
MQIPINNYLMINAVMNINDWINGTKNYKNKSRKSEII